jgi:hypothetical protein
MTLTAKQAKAQRRALEREINRDLKKKARAKLLHARGKLRDARAHKKARMKEIVESCRSERITLRQRLKEMRERVLQELRETARIERQAARDACLLRKGSGKTECLSAIECARRDYLAEKNYQADLRRIERGNRERHRAARVHLSRAERRGESDDEVRQNISPELVPLFERVKRSIKGSARMSRTEAFLKYAEENPHEVFEIVEEKTERMIRELEKKHEEAARAHARAGRAGRGVRAARPRYTPEELAAVPF